MTRLRISLMVIIEDLQQVAPFGWIETERPQLNFYLRDKAI